MSEPRAVIGSDGKLLGITYGEGGCLQRDSYPDDEDGWTQFMKEAGIIFCALIRRDEWSDHAKLLMKQDEERLAELRSQTPF